MVTDNPVPAENKDGAFVAIDDVFGPAPVADAALDDDVNPSPDEANEPSVDENLSRELRTIVEWVAVVVVAISVALLIKEFAFQAFEIPSGSMEPTVVPGDRILVNKLSYTFGEIERGDLVVFDRLEGTPGNTDQLIKRAIGLPGETVEIRDDGRLWIWGAGETGDDAVLLEEPYLNPGSATFRVPSSTSPPTADLWHESCANQPRTPGRCTLDDASYLMLGDNRASSTDSRFFGPVPEDHVVGRAVLRIWPLDSLSGL